MNTVEIDADAQLIWDYHHMNQELKPCEAIFVLCSMDTRVAERAVELFKDGYGSYVIASGGTGRLTKDVFSQPEAQVFAGIIVAHGVPVDKIIIEDESTNTGENIQLTHELLQKGLNFGSLLLVQKPYMERRTYATFKKQWPDPTTEILVTSPQVSYAEYFNETCPKELVLNVMVGDLQRIKEYAARGFQIEQAIPDDVLSAYERLVDAGYDKHLINN
jgi:uncharacterized SAM-binding protein YcdF (DUF218 family)